jgi:hypothetical protein
VRQLVRARVGPRRRGRPPHVGDLRPSCCYPSGSPTFRIISYMRCRAARKGGLPLVRRSRLISGSCPSTRTFAPRFLQTPPRGDSPCASLTLHPHQVG